MTSPSAGTHEAPRSRVLPTGRLRGRFLLADGALAAAERLLPTYRGPDGDHEGIVFLAGREFDGCTLFACAIAPDAEHGCGRVFCTREHVLAAARAARRVGLALLAQVHSHPTQWSYHSEGDDGMVLMPFEGMLSIVVPHYGQFGLRPVHSLGLHQFQDGRWVVCTPDSIRDGLVVVPGHVDLR